MVPTGTDGLIWWLSLVMAVGTTAVLPVLPLYAHAEGASLVFIGWMVGAYMITNLIALYPAGWLSDRAGRRLLMGVGLAAFAVASFGFLLFHQPVAFVVLRSIEGLAGACFAPAAFAYVADRAPERERGLRIAQLTMAQNVGMLLGPLFGGAMAAAFGLSSPFLALALLCGVGALIAAKLPAAEQHAAPYKLDAPGNWQQVNWPLTVGLACRSASGGFSMGLYETIWPLFMQGMGASTWDISLSWTLFGVPGILLTAGAGRMIDRSGSGRPAVFGALFSSLVTLGYAFTHRVEVLLILCTIEGIGFAYANPAQNELQIAAAPLALRGRLIGIISALRTLGALAGALVTPALYGSSPFWTFALTAGLLFLGSLALSFGIAWADRAERAASRV